MNHREILRNFINQDGLLKQMPVKHRLRASVYLWAAEGLEEDKRYSEGQINAHIQRILAFKDPVTIRRALVECGIIDRTPDGREYWKTEKTPTVEDILNIW